VRKREKRGQGDFASTFDCPKKGTVLMWGEFSPNSEKEKKSLSWGNGGGVFWRRRKEKKDSAPWKRGLGKRKKIYYSREEERFGFLPVATKKTRHKTGDLSLATGKKEGIAQPLGKTNLKKENYRVRPQHRRKGRKNLTRKKKGAYKLKKRHAVQKGKRKSEQFANSWRKNDHER